jgi:hypothetical protein
MKTKTKITKKPALRNPAAVMEVSEVAKSEAGQTVIKNASENQKAVIQATASVIPFIVKSVFVLGIGYWVYRKYINRFESLREVSNYPDSNITNAQAITKAETIYGAMKGAGNGFQIVATNIANLNYNAWVKVYNAFGNRQGAIPFSSKMNLVEWFADQFNDEELAQLRFLVPNVF